jgi:WD40 repeat protein
VVVWDPATGKVRLNTGPTDLAPLGFSADGKSLVLGTALPFEEAQLQLWDLATGKPGPARVLTKRPAWPVLSADGATVTTVTGHGQPTAHTVQTWDVRTGKALDSFDLDPVKTLAFHRAGGTGPFRAVVETPKGLGLLTRDPKGGRAATADLPGVTRAALSADGEWVAGHSDRGVALFDAAGKKRWSAAGAFSQFTLGVAGGYVVATDGGGKVYLHDPESGKVVRAVPTGSGNVTAWALAPDGKTLYVAGAKGKSDEYSVQAFDLGAVGPGR